MNPSAPRPARPARPTSRPAAPRAQAAASRSPAAASGAPTSAAPAGTGVPLWQQLMLVCQALQGIRGGQSGTAVIEGVEPRLRPGVQALLFQVLRNLGRADALRSQLVARKPPPAADALLCTALALAWDPQAAPYEPFTLVDQAVEAAKRGQATRGRPPSSTPACAAFCVSVMHWWPPPMATPLRAGTTPPGGFAGCGKTMPADWERILQANNAHAPMALRVNQQKCTLAQYQQALAAINLEAKVVGPQGLELAQPVPVQVLPGFADGWVSVQDAAAQQAAPLVLQGLDLTQPLRVLDACAAPGGKTAHLLEHAPAGSPLQVTALEVDEKRSARIHDTLARLGLSAQVLVADASRPQDWWQSQCGGTPFDAILLDAPCTASGIVRRHPDVRWLRRESDVAQLAQLQRQILEALWPLLKPGGRLLYCTCSVFKAEGDLQIQTFLAHNTNAQLLPSPGHLIPGVGENPGLSGTIRQVTTTVSFTPCCKNRPIESLVIRWLRFVVCCWALWWAPGAAVFAQQDAGEAQGLRIERAEDGLYLGASFDFTLPDLAQDALHKGIPMFFADGGPGSARPLVLVGPCGGRSHALPAPELPAAHAPLAAQHLVGAVHQQRAGRGAGAELLTSWTKPCLPCGG